jgi:hypothetical protein
MRRSLLPLVSTPEKTRWVLRPRRPERFLPGKWIASAILAKILIPQMDQNGDC